MKKILSIMWHSHSGTLKRAGKALEGIIDVGVYSSRYLDEGHEDIGVVLKEAEEADVILLYRSTESIWDVIEKSLNEIGKSVPIICVGHDPSYWAMSNVKPDIVARVHTYITYNGEENFIQMLCYIANAVCGVDIDVEPPKPIPWEGLYHPDAPDIFDNIENYLKWYGLYKRKPDFPKTEGAVGLLFSRFHWVNKNLGIEDTLIRKVESLGLVVIPVFSYSVRDDGLGTKGSGEVVCEYFLKDGKPRIDALINLQMFLIGSSRASMEGGKVALEGVDILKRLDVPVFMPVTSYYKTMEEWWSDPHGTDGSSIGWSIAMPEFEGRIEPIIIGGLKEKGGDKRIAFEERMGKLARRVANWIRLKRRPVGRRKIAFMLHNNPCASVEATVGAGAHLDTLESVARIINKMKAAGYDVVPPKDGKELIDAIMNRKAISEFRWTTTDEIVEKGGVLKMVTKEEYEEWFNALSETVRKRVCEAWGDPPGVEKDGIPAAMVHDGKILVTGVDYGNAVVCVQPKRGCAGARCDGRVCKILHDPDVPPPHQYMATYRYLEYDFKADAIVHVGTHGNLEFLPGKGTALSGDCYPDIAIGHIPHLYIYNADNPPEGTIAKRRSYATLVDHMQTVMTQGGVYEELEELGRFLGEYEQVKGLDKARVHALEHLIMDAIKKTNLDKEIKVSTVDKGTGRVKRVGLCELDDEGLHALPFDEIVREAHGALSRTRNTQIQDGMHVFGELPEGERRAGFIYSILRYDAGEDVSLRREIAKMMGLDLSELLSNPGGVHPVRKKGHGELLEEIDRIGKRLIEEVINMEG
ncbi:cobaltochelatase subunit CobN [Dissulfurimicrobium hydrothermale]|uniref:cobaltochelatase subunit CobN n=1 Tax=Dissulfurimicrobium hydrothermale TaxID=1750598 RepID=UPI002ED6A2C8